MFYPSVFDFGYSPHDHSSSISSDFSANQFISVMFILKSRSSASASLIFHSKSKSTSFGLGVYCQVLFVSITLISAVIIPKYTRSVLSLGLTHTLTRRGFSYLISQYTEGRDRDSNSVSTVARKRLSYVQHRCENTSPSSERTEKCCRPCLNGIEAWRWN